MKLTCKLVVLTVLFSSTTAAFPADAVKETQPQQKVLASSNGRYVFGQISEYRRDQYMLDTQSGKLWVMVIRKTKKPDGSDASGEGSQILEPIPYVDLEERIGVLPR